MNPQTKPTLDSIFGNTLGQQGLPSDKPTLNDIFSGTKTVEDIKEPGYFQRVAEQYRKGGEKVNKAFEKPEKFPGQTILNTAGAVAGAAFAPITAALEPALKPVVEKLATIPGVENKIKDIAEWAKKHPTAATSLQSVFDIATLGLGGVGEKLAKDIAVKTGESVGQGVESISTGVGDVVGTALEKTGQKIQNTVIKPLDKDIKDGFVIGNVAKYDVGGSLPEVIAKTHTKMNALSKELKSKLKSTDAKVDLNKVIRDTENKLIGKKATSFGDNSAIERIIESLKKEVKNVSADGNADLITATNIKRGAGRKGAWAYSRPEPDAGAIEKVYTEFYSKLKTAIEKNAPEGVKDINKQISELIPINNAALRRMTVEERNNALSLMDNIGLISSVFDPRALLIFGANKAMKSGKVGQFLTKAGQKLKATDISPTK